MLGTIDKDTPTSKYQPSDAELALAIEVKSDYQTGHNILTRTWTELNNQSVIEDMNRGRMMFNAFVDDSSETPEDAWKWRGTRSVARNKGIGMHANLTAAYLLPTFQAQNSDQENDKGLSDFMTDIVEWMAQDQNSDYKPNFLSLVFAMETDPIVYLGAEYLEVEQEIKIKEEDGRYSKKEILDEVLSGFKAPIYTADQILISNAFERNVQKHRFNITRKWIEYEEAKARYEDHPNFEYVKPGTTVVYNESDGLFYEVKDDEHPNLVEEVTYKRRRDDLEICYLGGIYMGDTETEQNRIKHRDNFDAPRYNIQPFGFYPIGSHFIFSKSMMAALRWDNDLYDAMAEIGMNRAILEADFPVAISGVEKLDGEITYPNAVVTMSSPEAKVQKLLPDSNLSNLFAAMAQTKESLSEGSINETISGQLPPASQKAYTVAQAQSNAKKIIGGVAKGLALSVSKYGLLMADIAINHYSTPQVDELTGDNTKLKYRKFILENKNVDGRRVAKQLVFDPNLVGLDMTPEQEDEYNLNLLEKTGYPDNQNHLYVANPELFAKMKYYAVADYREVFPQNDESMQALLQGLYGMLNADPMIEREALLRELMYSFFRGKGDRFIAKKPMAGMGGLPAQAPGAQSSPVASSTLSTSAGAQKVI